VRAAHWGGFETRPYKSKGQGCRYPAQPASSR